MPIPGSSFLATIKQKLRKAPPAMELPKGEDPSPRLPTANGPGIGNAPETIALAIPSPSKNARTIHEIVNPFIDPEDSKPNPPDPGVDHPDPQAQASDETEKSAESANELVADAREDPQAEASDETENSDQSGNEAVADTGVDPQAQASDETENSDQSGNEEVAASDTLDLPETVDQGEGAAKGPVEESSPDSENGQFVLREMFARKSVAHPTIKALLKRHHPVDTRALSQELKEFALQLGLSPPND